MRSLAGALPVSKRKFGTAKGLSEAPRRNSPQDGVSSPALKVDGMGEYRAVQKGTAAVAVERALQVLRAHRVVVAVTQIVLAGPGDLTGWPTSRANSAASTTKSGFDLRPNAPPSHVT